MGYNFYELNGSFEEMSSSETLECLQEYRKNNDIRLRDKMFNAHYKYILYSLHKYYYNLTISEDDKISIGLTTLFIAIEKFDVDKGYNFISYLNLALRNNLYLHLRKNIKHDNLDSFDSPQYTNEYNNSESCSSYIKDGVDFEETVLNKVVIEMILQSDLLNETEKEIIIKRYGLYGTKACSQKKLAASFNFSQSYLSKIEEGIKLKIRNYLEGDTRGWCK